MRIRLDLGVLALAFVIEHLCENAAAPGTASRELAVICIETIQNRL